MLQFTAGPSYNQNLNSLINDPLINLFLLIFMIALIILAIIFVLRSFLRTKKKKVSAFDRIVLQILVPKERKSEGQGGQGNQEDRLEQIREEIGWTETIFSAIASTKARRGFYQWMTGRDDHISFEMVASNNLITFYVAVPTKIKNFIEQQIHSQYPHAEINQMTDYNIFHEDSHIVGAHLSSKKKHFFPIKTYKKIDSDPLNVILNVLSKINENDSSLAVQYVVRTAHKKWRRAGVRTVREVKKGEQFEKVISGNPLTRAIGKTSKEIIESMKSKTDGQKIAPDEKYQMSAMEEEMLKGIEEKISKGGMDVTIRLLSSANNPENARINLDNLISAYGQYNLYRYGAEIQATIPRNQKQLIKHFIYRSFNENRYILANTEEMASLWHLPLHSTEAPNIKWLQGRSAPPPSNLPDSGIKLGFVDYRGVKNNIFLKEADRRRHLYIIGKSGSGKSVTIANLAIQDILEGKGVGIVDPHGDLIEAILEHIPKERADDVVIFDPSDTERPIGLNMLEAKTADQKDFAVQEMIGIFYKLFPPEMIGPMFEHQMRNVMLTLMADIENPGTIIDIPRMFTDDDYVKQYLEKVTDPVVRAYWEKEMAKTSDFHKSEMLGYLISKVGRFVGNEMMRNVMGQQKSAFSFREIMDNKKILLVNLAKGKTGEVNAKLLGLIVVAKLQMAAMARADTAEEDRHDFYLYIDEFQNFITDSISTILSEARKYKLDLIIAHQYMGQLTDDKGKSDVRDAVLGNVGTVLSGRIGPDDAEILAKEFAPVFGSYDLLNCPKYSFYTKILIDNQASKPFLMGVYPPVRGNRELASAIKELSRLKYGRDKTIVEAEIMERTKLDESAKESKTDMTEASL